MKKPVKIALIALAAILLFAVIKFIIKLIQGAFSIVNGAFSTIIAIIVIIALIIIVAWMFFYASKNKKK